MDYVRKEYVLAADLNDLVRVSGRVDHTLIDSEGHYWFILMTAQEPPTFQREYKYTFMIFAAREQMTNHLQGKDPKVGIYDLSRSCFTTFNLPPAEQERLIEELLQWAGKVQEVILARRAN